MYEISVQGDFGIGRTMHSLKSETGLSVETLSASRTILADEKHRLYLSAGSNKDALLPDAQTLEVGWAQEIECAFDSVGSILIKTYDAVTPILLKTLVSGAAVRVYLLDNSTAAGTWSIDIIAKTETSAAERYIVGFNATTDWGTAAGGYYTKTVAAAVHGLGTNPVVSLQKSSGSDFKVVQPDGGGCTIYANGDVSFRVPETPDLRFAGRVVIS